MAILAIAFLVLCAVCAIKESKVTGLYKTFGCYGRFGAYLGLFCPMGLGMFVASFFMEDIGAERWLYLLLGVIGAGIYYLAYLKAPAFLKKRVIPAMILSGFGVCIKLCIFFIGAVWRLAGPAVVTSETGEELYVVGNEVYNGRGDKIGVANADKSAYVKYEN